MLSLDKHLDNLIRHINLVRDNCIVIGKKLIEKGRVRLGVNIIARGFEHDVSKFRGIEWEYLHNGKDTPKDMLEMAVFQHNNSNSHHAEYHDGFEHMGELDILEMACDITARSQEFGQDIRDWIAEEGIKKYNIDVNSNNYKLLMSFIDMLTENMFVKE